jgi:hypothetical protein
MSEKEEKGNQTATTPNDAINSANNKERSNYGKY